MGIKISDLDLESEISTITIRPEINKTGKSDIIPIRAKMVRIFEQLIIENGGRSEYVFNYDEPHTGEYRNITTFRRSFNAACRRAGIKGLQPRDLRRTCATRLHEAGVDPLIIKRFMRHSSSGMTEKVYIQSSLKMMKQALDKVDKGHEKVPFQNQFRTDLEHEKTTEKTSETLRCLFSMN